jgi:hypothetical protein
MLQRAIGIFNENMRRRHNYDGMSQRMRAKFDAELDDRRKRLWDATKAVAPGPVTFATMLDRAKAIQAEFKKQCNNEETR